MQSENDNKNRPEKALGIYVHVPYCIRKCRYCDFVSFEKAPEDAYFDKLAEDIELAGNAFGNGTEYYVDTLFFGGGTPSLASAAQLKKVLDAVRENFVLREPEITIEVNPETVTPQKAAELKELGFNRVSMGVQSLDDGVLSALGRVHSADRARQAFHTLRDTGFENINLDLIFGTPRDSADESAPVQRLEVWRHTLDEVLAMRPEHISFYSLQIEEGTPLYKDFAAEKIQIPSWEENREMYHSAIRQIKEHGYHHYEVSNAALPGFECRHNLKYWTMQPYLGFGISAHSFMPVYGENGRLTAGYRGEAAWSCTGEPQSLADLKGDFIFTQLRLTEGLNASFYRQLFGEEFSADFGKALEELAAKGYIIDTERGVRLTEKGLDNINPVMQTLLEELQWKRNT
ncbi:MAG: radical SAM family heme chaperone HemW [Firmicutes bacterium]|nr:radical SAM family heme chaperone HemW [Bacillota bacterium]